MAVHCLTEVLENIWEVVPYMGETSNKRVEVSSQSGFWKFTEEGITEITIPP